CSPPAATMASTPSPSMGGPGIGDGVLSSSCILPLPAYGLSVGLFRGCTQCLHVPTMSRQGRVRNAAIAGEEQTLNTLDLKTPCVARMYDYLLGGRDNFAADREAVAEVVRHAPDTPYMARENRAFLHRAVRFLAKSGVRQFIDIGSGLPTQGNV